MALRNNYYIDGMVTFINTIPASGTSSVIRRIVENVFVSSASTPSMDGHTKVLNFTPDGEGIEESVRLQLRDADGYDRWIGVWCKNADAIVFTVDSTVPLAEQTDKLLQVRNRVSKHNSAIPVVVITKIDLTNKRRIDLAKDTKKLQEIFGESVEIVETSAQTGEGIPQLTNLFVRRTYQKWKSALAALTSVVTSKPMSAPAQTTNSDYTLPAIMDLFDKASAELQEENEAPLAESKNQESQLKRKVFINHLTSSSGKDFKAYLITAKARMLAEVESGRVTAETAHQAATVVNLLARQVATCTVTIADIKDFSTKIEPALQQSTRLSRIFGSLMVAALGVFIGMMVGAAAGPVAAFAALALGKASATSGAVIGGLVGGWLGSEYSLWAHPLSKMKNAAAQVEKIVEQPTVKGGYGS